MGYRVKGTLKLPDGSPASNAEIEFISRKNFSPLVQELKSNILCGLDGAYDVTLEYGEYAVMVYPGGTYPASLGTIVLAADTVAGQDLPTLLQQAGWQPATPEYIQQIGAWLAEANSSASSSTSSAGAAKVSETNAKASENAALSSENSAASSASTAATKAAEAASSSSAALASKNAAATSETNALSSKDAAAASASTAVAAADTATQKALAAAGSEASALSSATRAEQAAQAMVGALIDAGPYNAASGVLPTPSMSSGVKRSSVWKVTGSGTAGGIELGVGDSLVYTASDSSYYKIDNTESVTSVNGRKGVVTLSSSDVGADDYGTAQNLVTQHAAKSGAHAISGVSGLQDALNAKEAAGAATSAVDGHAAKSGAHPISGVSGLQASLDSKYSASNKPTTADVTGLDEALKNAGGSPVLSTAWVQLRTAMWNGYVPADGQTLSRSLYPDAFAAIQAGLVPVCTDAEWLADPAKRGCFTLGDGSTTFRVPDYNGKFDGSMGAVFQRGDGLNSAGVNGHIQGDAIRNITGKHMHARIDSRDNASGVFSRSVLEWSAWQPPTATGAPATEISFDASSVVPTANENRPVNVTGCWAVKLFGAVQNAGEIDAMGLATQVANLDSNKPDKANVVAPMANGGVIERGSNANGEYVKFADGTMICTVTNFTLVNPVAAASRFIEKIITFPAAFIDLNYSSSFVISGNAANHINWPSWSSGYNYGGSAVSTRSTGNATCGIYATVNGTTSNYWGANSEARDCSFIAIGRWK